MLEDGTSSFSHILKSALILDASKNIFVLYWLLFELPLTLNVKSNGFSYLRSC